MCVSARLKSAALIPLPANNSSRDKPSALKASSTNETALRVVRWEWSMLGSSVEVLEPSNLCAGLWATP
jgi:hypothetical protein